MVKTNLSGLLTITMAVVMTGSLHETEIHKILKYVEMYGPLSPKAIQIVLEEM
jgi:hypothetical protein